MAITNMRVVATAKLPSQHCAFFCLVGRLEKSRNSFLQNFANGGHCEIAIITLCFLSSCLTLRKKSKFIFAKFCEWWPSRNCHHNTALFSPFLTLRKKSKFIFAKFREWWPLRNCHHNTVLSSVLFDA